MAKFGLGSIKIYRRKVVKAMEKASDDSLRRCGMLVEDAAKRSMRAGGGKAQKPSPPGDPPHVQTGTLRSSIAHAVRGRTAVVGPTERYGKYHEYGTRHHPERPFMAPALRKVEAKFPKEFEAIL